jgi:hypothetical protein
LDEPLSAKMTRLLEGGGRGRSPRDPYSSLEESGKESLSIWARHPAESEEGSSSGSYSTPSALRVADDTPRWGKAIQLGEEYLRGEVIDPGARHELANIPPTFSITPRVRIVEHRELPWRADRSRKGVRSGCG